MAYDDVFGSASTLRDRGAYAVQPSEVSFTPPAPQPPASVSKIRAIKALREVVYNNDQSALSLKQAKDAVDTIWRSIEDQGGRVTTASRDELVLTPAEAKAAGVAARQVHANQDVRVQAIVAAINEVRNNDPVGTLRQSITGEKYGFAHAPGKWLLIDLSVSPARFKGVEGSEAAAIQNTWKLIVEG